MKHSIFKLGLILSISLGMSFIACSDDDDDDVKPSTTNNSTSNACNGGDGFCMSYGGVEKSGSARLTVQSNNNKIRVYWENGSGSSFEQVELDVYSLDTGTFQVNDLAIANSSAFVQYFSTAGGVVNPAYGTVSVNTLDTINGVTGTFSVTMKDSTKVTNGKFTNIVK